VITDFILRSTHTKGENKTKIYCQNTEAGLIPLYDSDLQEKKKLKIGKTYACEIRFERNYELLKKFMALIKLGQENSKNVEMPFDAYRNYATIKAGYSNVYQTPKGVFVEAQSIAFASMTEEKFEKVYSDVLDFIIKDTEADAEFIQDNLINFM